MKCSRCGSDIEAGKLFCFKCGQEVQIVPDYSPVEELVIQNVVDAQNPSSINNKYVDKAENTNVKPDNFKDIDTKTESNADNTASVDSVASLAKNQKRITVISAVAVGLIVITIIVNAVILIKHNNSFEYQKACGYVEMEDGDFEKAYRYFEKALTIDDTNIEVRFLIAEIQKNLGDIKSAEMMYKEVLDIDNINIDAGKELLKLYSENGMSNEITIFFNSIEDTELYTELKKYHIDTPNFSVSPGDYQRFIAVEILCSTENAQIYYTVDGTNPTSDNGIPYSGLIRLPNGTTTIKAVAINQEGYISGEIEGTYIINYKAPENPVFALKGGDYYYAMPISITVPSNCEVYYTTNGSIPTEHSKKYNGYIDMPIGNNTIRAVAIDKSGFVSSTVEADYNLNFDARFTIEQAEVVIMAHLANNLVDARGSFNLNCDSAYSVGEFNLYIFEKIYGTDINGNQIINEEQKFAFDVLTGETYIAYPNGAGGYNLEAF